MIESGVDWFGVRVDANAVFEVLEDTAENWIAFPQERFGGCFRVCRLMEGVLMRSILRWSGRRSGNSVELYGTYRGSERWFRVEIQGDDQRYLVRLWEAFGRRVPAWGDWQSLDLSYWPAYRSIMRGVPRGVDLGDESDLNRLRRQMDHLVLTMDRQDRGLVKTAIPWGPVDDLDRDFNRLPGFMRRKEWTRFSWSSSSLTVSHKGEKVSCEVLLSVRGGFVTAQITVACRFGRSVWDFVAQLHQLRLARRHGERIARVLMHHDWMAATSIIRFEESLSRGL